MCGAGVGTFIFAPFTQFLIEEYSWRGAMLVEAGILLNGAVCGAMLRPVTVPVSYRLAFDAGTASASRQVAAGPVSSQFVSPRVNSRRKQPVGRGQSLLDKSSTAADEGASPSVTTSGQHFYNSLLSLTMSSCSLPTQHDVATQRKAASISCRVFCSGVFVLFIMATVLASVGFCVPYIFIPDRAVQRGQSEDRAAVLISVLGISNTLGRVLSGYVSDFAWVNRIALFWISLILCGITSFLSAFCFGFSSMVAYCFLIGFFMGE